MRRRTNRQPLVDYDSFPHQHVTPRELAEFLRCDPRTVLRMIDAGALPAFRVGRNYRIAIGDARLMFPCGHVKQHRDTSRDISGRSAAVVHD